jgi:hypothetical protein
MEYIKRLKANYLFADLFFWDCNIFFAFSNSRLREAGKSLPARLMKYCIISMPEPIPLGLTFFEAICRAIVSASLVNIPFLGNVDSVVTFLTHCFLLLPALLDDDDGGMNDIRKQNIKTLDINRALARYLVYSCSMVLYDQILLEAFATPIMDRFYI